MEKEKRFNAALDQVCPIVVAAQMRVFVQHQLVEFLVGQVLQQRIWEIGLRTSADTHNRTQRRLD
jgi:hypothetical protein